MKHFKITLFSTRWIFYRCTNKIRQNHLIDLLLKKCLVFFELNQVQCRYVSEVTGDMICPNMVRGIDHLRDPRLNKVSSMYLISIKATYPRFSRILFHASFILLYKKFLYTYIHIIIICIYIYIYSCILETVLNDLNLYLLLDKVLFFFNNYSCIYK